MFYNKEGKEIKRQPCQVYSRCMWYIRPISHYNTGKKSEFYSRKRFKVPNNLENFTRFNTEFNSEFSTTLTQNQPQSFVVAS